MNKSILDDLEGLVGGQSKTVSVLLEKTDVVVYTEPIHNIMPDYACSTCNRIFHQKSHLAQHMNRKIPCVRALSTECIIETRLKNILPKENGNKKTLTYVDLFAGIGGFRYGLEAFSKLNPNYSFRCIKTVDIKKDANVTYNVNFMEDNPLCDIRTVTNLPTFDILCAGFPCQPFSSAGKKEGFEDGRGRGDLIFEVLRICKESTPEYILLENVANIETIDNGKTLKRIVSEFTDVGYKITVKKVNAIDVGLAQDRSRVFIIGSRTREIVFDLAPPHTQQKVSDIIDTEELSTDLPASFIESLMKRSPESLYGMSIKDKRGGKDNLHSWDIDYHGVTTQRQKDLMNMILKERRKKKWAELKDITWMDGMPLTCDEIRTFINYPELDIDLLDLEKKGYLVQEHPKELVNNKRVYKVDSPKGYNICKGKLSFPISKILHPNMTSPTLTATDSSKLAVHVGTTIRRLTKKELARLCGFPDCIQIPNDVDPYDVFGNMVCPPVVTAILQGILH
jgi:DNA (cytosine-5)-methyltransferase 1